MKLTILKKKSCQESNKITEIKSEIYTFHYFLFFLLNTNLKNTDDYFLRVYNLI